MQRILVVIFVLYSSILKSQIVNDSVIAFNCYNDGAIFLDLHLSSQVDYWFFNDDTLGWVNAISMQDIQFSNNLDSLITQKCGSYKVVVSGDTSFYYIACPLGSRGDHLNVKCFGDSTGVLKRVAHSGTPPYFYQWYMNSLPFSSGYDDTLFDNLVIGSYQIIITDSVGCKDSILTNISSPPVLGLDSLFTYDINCRNVSSGIVSAFLSGGKKYTVNEKYDYYLIDLNLNDTVLFLNRDSIPLNFFSTLNPYNIVFDSLNAGEYIISIVDSFGCLLDDTFKLIEPDPYQAFASTIFPLICESDSGYLMVDSIIGGDSINYGFNYDLNQGVFGDSLYVSGGLYNVFIEDLDFGCLDTVSVSCNPQFEISVFETINHVKCFGDSSGSVVIDSIIGGNTPYDIQWGNTNSVFLSAGIYSVYIVDAIGCVHYKEYEISEPNQINNNAIVYPISCNGMNDGGISINVSGGLGSLSYFWLNGIGITDSLYGLSDGIYTLVISDTNQCVDTFNFHMHNPQILEVDLVAEDSILPCYGALTLIDVNISGGTSPYSIHWTDGDTSQQRILGEGYYEVEVIDANGCSTLAYIIIAAPELLQVTISYTNMSCTEGATATVISNGGVSPISYLWSTGDTVFSIDSLWESTYWIVAIDSCGNYSSDTIYLNSYELNTDINYDSLEYIAEIQIQSTISLGPFEHEWLDIFGDSIGFGTISPVLCEGIYFVNTIDLSNNCDVTDTILVDFYIPLGIVDITNTTIYSDDNLWGYGPYTYLWSNGEVSQHADICPGDHWVEVTDINGCMIREEFIIEEILITLDPATAIIECNLENLDVNIEASATGGVEPYSYEWSNGSKDNSLNLSINPGNYTLFITDGNGCIVDTSFVVATMTSECVPNVFTPNGDNINDTWSLEDTFLYENTEVKIYGRFGSLLFQSIGYHKQWDGKNEQGIDVPDGVYFYSIDIGNGFDSIKGTVTILR
tara:strand:+ start:7370 stop:10270 length:2901 start_codon:yes stop_codon:yes gene_type:complete